LIAKKGSNKYLLINISFEEKKMSNKKILPFLIFLLVAVFMAACSGTVEDVATDNADTVNAAATEAAAQLEEAAPTIEAAVEEAQEAVEEAMEEPTEEAMEEEVMEEPTEEAMEEEAMEPCGPAAEGEFAGVDPRGQTVVWWHNHSGSREELLLPLIEQ
jgi:hypothetical protein